MKKSVDSFTTKIPSQSHSVTSVAIFWSSAKIKQLNIDVIDYGIIMVDKIPKLLVQSSKTRLIKYIS